jgi:hypothetical protein
MHPYVTYLHKFQTLDARVTYGLHKDIRVTFTHSQRVTFMYTLLFRNVDGSEFSKKACILIWNASSECARPAAGAIYMLVWAQLRSQWYPVYFGPQILRGFRFNPARD